MSNPPSGSIRLFFVRFSYKIQPSSDFVIATRTYLFSVLKNKLLRRFFYKCPNVHEKKGFNFDFNHEVFGEFCLFSFAEAETLEFNCKQMTLFFIFMGCSSILGKDIRLTVETLSQEKP